MQLRPASPGLRRDPAAKTESALQNKCHDVAMRVATWNLDHSNASAPQRRMQRAQVTATAADVWIFTEADASPVPRGFETVTSDPIPGSAKPLYFAVLAAEHVLPRPVIGIPTAAAGLVHTAHGPWIVLGICTPWRRDAPPLPASAAPGAETGPEQWDIVLQRLDLALTRLRADAPGIPLLLAGDFNQTLDGYIVGSKAGRLALSNLLARHRLTAYTKTSPSAFPGCAAVDHICGPNNAATPETWSNLDSTTSAAMSDHAGYIVSI